MIKNPNSKDIQKFFLQALEHHQNGRLEKAENLYYKILADQPYHPDANHNLGVLNVALGNLLLAIKFFKKAVGVNPSYEQFWHSYIYTLVKCGQIEDAKKSFNETDRLGISSKRLSELKESLASRIQNKNFKTNAHPHPYQLDELLDSFQKKKFYRYRKKG